MVTTNNDELAERMNTLRNHGASISEEQRHQGPQPYLLPDFNLLGFNYRMTDLQGAVGLVQLSKLETFTRERQNWANFYEEQLTNVSWLKTPSVPEYAQHGWQAYVCYIDESKSPMPRNNIMQLLQEKGISTRPGTHAVHMIDYYKKHFGLKSNDYPNSRDCDQFSMAIPLHNKMSADDYQYIVKTIRAI